MLELLVVLAIMAGLIALALPQFGRLYARVRVSYERSELERQLLELPQRVRQEGRGGILLDPSDERGAAALQAGTPEAENADGLGKLERLKLDLPPGWTVKVPKPILYRFSGACDGGEVDLALPPTVLRYVLVPPLCRPQLAENNAAR